MMMRGLGLDVRDVTVGQHVTVGHDVTEDDRHDDNHSLSCRQLLNVQKIMIEFNFKFDS